MTRDRKTMAIAALMVAASAAQAQAQPAGGEPREAVLLYERADAASACLDEAALRGEVAARLGYEPFAPGAETLVRVTIDRPAGEHVARVEVWRREEAPGMRELRSTAADCRDLDDALVFAVSMAIDPGAALAPAAPAPEPEPEPAPKPEAPPEPVPEPEPIEPPVEANWRADAGVGVSLGSVPGPALSLSLGGEVAWPVVSLRLSGRADLPASEPVTQVDGGGEVEASLLVGELAGCARGGAFFACAVGAGGALRAEGIGVEGSRAVTRPYVGLGGRLGGEYALGENVALRGQAQVLGNLVRTSLYVGDEAVWRSAPVGATFGASVVFTFF